MPRWEGGAITKGSASLDAKVGHFLKIFLGNIGKIDQFRGIFLSKTEVMGQFF